MANPRRRLFGICAGLFLMSMLLRASTAVIAPDLSRDLRLRPEDLGLLGAVFFYVFASIQFPLGLFLDRFGARRTMIWLNLCGTSGSVFFALSGGLPGALTARALIGLGMSANLMGSLKLYTRWFRPHEFATVSGFMLSAGSLGGVLATSPFLLVVQHVGWRGAYLILALINLVLTVGLIFWVGDNPPESTEAPTTSADPDRPSVRESLRQLVTDRSYWVISVTAGIRYGIFAAIQTLWAGPYLMIHLGLPALTAGNLLLLLTVGGIVGAPLSGMISDRVLKSRKKTVFASMVCMVAAVAILVYWPGPVHLGLLSLVLLGFGFFGSFGHILYAHIKDLMPSRMAGTAMAGTNFFIMMGAGVFLQGLGGILGRGGTSLAAGIDYPGAFLFCGVVLAVATILYAFSRDAGVGPADSGRR